MLSSQIKAGTRVSLPLWLSTLLAVQRLGPSSQTLCTLDLPASISPRVLAALKAGPKTVDLRQLASHYYDLAARVLDLFEEEEIVDVLSEVREMTAWPTWGEGLGGLRRQACVWHSRLG